MRVLVPRAPKGMNVSARPASRRATASQKILDEERRTTTTTTTRPSTRPSGGSPTTPLLISLLLAGSACSRLFLLAPLATRAPRPRSRSTCPSRPTTPRPALAYGLAHEGGDSTDTVLATLLDLVDRGYYDADQATTEKEKLDLSLTVASKRPHGEAGAPREGGPELLRRAARGRHGPDERDEGPDPRAQRDLARRAGRR